MREYTKVTKVYTENTINVAIQEVEDGASIKFTSRKYGMSHALLWGRMHDKNQNITFSDQRGKKTFLSNDLELTFLDLIQRMEKMGLSPTVTEFLEIVHDYLEANEIVTPFIDNRPGRDWLRNFLKRHNLALKKGASTPERGTEMISYTAGPSSDPYDITDSAHLRELLGKYSTETLINAVRDRAPAGMEFSFKFKNSRGFTPTCPSTIEQVLHMRGRSATEPAKKRQKITMKAQVITNDECLAEIKKKNEQKMKPKQPRKKK